MKVSEIGKRLEQLVVMGNSTLSTRHTVHSEMFGSNTYVKSESGLAFRSASLNFLRTVYDETNPYYIEFEKHVSGHQPNEIEIGISILEAVRQELESGWLISFKEIVSAEIFSDFIEMAQHLISQNYKDAAAVIIGSILEENLRLIASKNEVLVESERDGKMVPHKADRVNSELAKAGVYNKLDQKQVTAWLDLRNCAAHGKYNQYNMDQVRAMYTGVVDFIARSTRF